jgi:alpha-galactosidase
LQPGEQLELPAAWIALSDTGWTGVSHLFHRAIRSAAPARRRLVHFNTWEARYFDFDLASCQDLARSAASLGVERFVLDDGWFKGRRDDRTSLGDWTVDPLPFPDGLQPLIDTVHAHGMRFGLWVEPEMVSPDSDLFRAHPDWVLGYPDPDLATGRNQLVLDLSLPEASDYVFNALSALLESYPIDYLKWDCNRDLYPASRGGVERAGAQTQALYALLARLRAAHPVEIESCASGGGRIDAGIARHTDRFWASDATDAIDRLRIQRSASLIMPVERLGAHVGPSPNPMTGRQVPMAFRVLSAFFGHFGVEADPDRLDAEDADILRRGIEQYKLHRDWMLTGDLIRLEAPDFDPDIQMLIGEDQAMLRIMRIDTPTRPLTRRLRLAGLDPKADYDLTEIALSGEAARWPIGRYPGAGLMREGLDLDPGRALSGRLIHLERAD